MYPYEITKMKNCKVCGKSFLPTAPREEFCCEECRKEHQRQYQKEYWRKRRDAAKKVEKPVDPNKITMSDVAKTMKTENCQYSEAVTKLEKGKAAVTHMTRESVRTSEDPYRNSEGYPDPTAFKAIKNAEGSRYNRDYDANDEDVRFYKLLHTIFHVSELAGFDIQGRITFVDKKSGRVHK